MDLNQECLFNALVGAVSTCVVSSYFTLPVAPALVAGTIYGVSYTLYKGYCTNANVDNVPLLQRRIDKIGSWFVASAATRFAFYVVGVSFSAEFSVVAAVSFLIGSISMVFASKVYDGWQAR